MNFYQIVIVGVVLMAVAWDLSTRRIPNALTFGAALAGFVVHGYAGGWSGAGMSVAGWFVGVACFLPVFLLRGMGRRRRQAARRDWCMDRSGRDGLGRALFEHRRGRAGPGGGAVFRLPCTSLREVSCVLMAWRFPACARFLS